MDRAGSFGKDGRLASDRNQSDIIKNLFSPSISRCYLLIIIIIIIIIITTTTTVTRLFMI
jgi:hypothetical protein